MRVNVRAIEPEAHSLNSEKQVDVTPAVIPYHQWTNGGDDVLVVRFTSHDGKSSSRRLVNGREIEAEPFQHPMVIGEAVTAPDWDERAVCGGGIHGWAWGLSLGEGNDCDWSALWRVYGVKPCDIVLIEGKVKFRTGILRFMGSWQEAVDFVLPGQMAWVHQAARGAASATGERGAASATGWSGAASATGERGAASATGERGAASATGWSGAASATGERGAASATGERGAASATGWRGAASATGERGAASATGWSGAASATGWRGAASATGERGAASATGECSSAVVTGPYGKAKAGAFGCIALAWWNAKEHRTEMRCALVGCEGGLKSDTWYCLGADNGEFVAVEAQERTA